MEIIRQYSKPWVIMNHDVNKWKMNFKVKSVKMTLTFIFEMSNWVYINYQAMCIMEKRENEYLCW